VYRLNFFALLLMVLTAACGTAQSVQPTATPAPVVTEKVVLQLNWTHDGAWSGFYVADRDGFYQNAGLEVEMRVVFDADGNFLNTIDEVVADRAQFGIASADQLLIARAAGQPVVAIASLYQRHPLALVSLADKNITRPEDLIGKTVHVSANSQVVFKALLLSEGISASQVNIVERLDYTTNPLTDGTADVIDAWVTNEIPLLELAEQPFNAIYPADYGIELYPNVIFTTEDMILNHPDTVASFVAATVQGLQGAVADAEHAAALTVEFNPELTLESQVLAANQSLPLIQPANSQPGMMRAESWETAQEILLNEGLLSEPVDLTSAYNLTFLDRAYAA